MITIERPILEDIKGIQEVFYKTWLVTYPNKEVGITIEDVEGKYKDRYSESTIAKRIKEIEDQSNNRLFLVAKDNGKVVGACRLMIETDYNDLGAIYVLPDYQRQGIGQMFWTEALKFFDEAKDIVVRVVAYNEQAINFYKKLGFVDTGKRFTQERLKMPVSGNYLPEIEMVIKRNIN